MSDAVIWLGIGLRLTQSAAFSTVFITLFGEILRRPGSRVTPCRSPPD